MSRRARSRGATSPSLAGPRTVAAPHPHVPKNDKGGVFVSDADIEAAMRFLCKPGSDRVTLADLRAKLQPFFPDMPLSELRFLMGDARKKDMSAAEVKALLRDNTITNFDPVAEAFRVFDMGTGVADLGVLQDVFEHAGFDHLSQEDLKVLLETADIDGDGRITLEDFREMLAKASGATQATAAASAKRTVSSDAATHGGAVGAIEADDEVARVAADIVVEGEYEAERAPTPRRKM